jgi:hypothetical protein
MNRAIVAAAMGLALGAPAFAADSGLLARQAQIEELAAGIASELGRICPPAGPGDQAAYDRCRQSLFRESLLKNSLSPFVLWGRVDNKNPDALVKDTNLTQFAPDVLAGMYLPLFMFNGKHTVQYEEREKMFLVKLEVAFRNRLAPGEFPYPFWHSAEKWNTYQGANEIRLRFDPVTARVRVAQFTTRGANPAIVASVPVDPGKFDGLWMWTDSQGATQPQVTLFDGLFRRDNPYLHQLDGAYRTLALRMRAGQCDSCHVPNNPNEMKRLVLLQTPAHAAGEIKRVMKAVRQDRMPLDETGIEQPLDPKVKSALLQSGEAFEKLVDLAKAWEAGQSQTTLTKR